MKLRQATVVISCGLLAVAGVWLFRSNESTMLRASPDDIRSNESLESAVRVAQGDWPATPAARSPAPLPPKDAPLAQIIGPLQQRADRGDRKAACRLAMELLRCDYVARWAGIQANAGLDPEGDRLREGQIAAADAAASRELHQLERLMDCRAVPEALKARGAHYLVQAARAGEPEAMLRYADGQYWRADGRGVLSDPGFDDWRREAPGMLQRAMESGYPDAAIYLHIAHASEVGFMASLIRDDPEQALAARHLRARLFGRRSPLGQQGLDAAAQQRALELAAQWHRKYFNGRTYLKPLMGSLYSPSESPPFCSDAAVQP
jgi:hypothetical protein